VTTVASAASARWTNDHNPDAAADPGELALSDHLELLVSSTSMILEHAFY
jgi:hypothetical protein